MKKKNFTYSENSTCSIDNNIIYEHFQEDINRVLDKFHDFNKPTKSLRKSVKANIGLRKEDVEFFKEVYCPSKPLRTKHEVREKIFRDINSSEIGQNEWELIIFATSLENAYINDRMLFVKGKVGEGKSSIINYVFKYIYHTKKSFSNQVFPIVINCQGYRNKLRKLKQDEGDIENFLNQKIAIKLKNKLKSNIEPTNENFWNWYADSFDNTSYPSDILFVKDDDSDKIMELRKKEYESEYFFMNAAHYISEIQNKEINIVFDNIDPFEINIVKDFFWFSKNLIDNGPFKVVLPVREDTYSKLIREIEEIKIVEKIELSTDLEKILLRRCDVINKTIEKSKDRKPFKIEINNKQYEYNKESLAYVKNLISAITSKSGANTILMFSKRNVRAELQLLRIVLSSGLIPLISLGKVLTQTNFKDSLKNDYVIPPEFIVQAIVTFGFGTFFTKQSKKNKIPGIMNVLSNADHTYPMQIFIKQMILSYLEKNGNREGQSKDIIKQQFTNCIKKMPNKKTLLDSFDYCMYRLFNVGLIISPDIYYAKSLKEFNEHVNDIRISLLGQYYLNDLVNMPEYLFYIKDDVYLENTDDFDDAFYVYTEYPSKKYFWKNFKNLGKFLFEYGKLEIEHLKKLKSYNTFDIYDLNFNTHPHKLFTLKIISGLEEYANTPLYTKKMNHYMDSQIFDSMDLKPLIETKTKLTKQYNEEIKNEL